LTNEEFQRVVLEKLTSLDTDINDVKSDINGMKSDINGVKSDINTVKSTIQKLEVGQEHLRKELHDVKSSVIKIEQVHGEKLSILFDGLKQHDEKLDTILNRLDIIEDKIEGHDIQISVLNRRIK
jgi:chromosome segregation ATPase